MPKRILILVDQLSQYGGIERLITMKANYWADQLGHEVHIVSTSKKNKPNIYNLSKGITLEDISTNFIDGASLFHPFNLIRHIKYFFYTKRLLRRRKPDFILIAHQIPFFYYLPFIKGKSHIIKENHYSRLINISRTKKKILSIFESLYDYLVVLSPEEGSFYKSHNIVVIPNPIRLSDAQPKSIADKANIAIAILRFAPVKQLDKMIEAWEKFIEKRAGWTLYIYGDKNSPCFPSIEKLVIAKGLSKTILFKGATPNVHKAFEEAKALLMTSSNECFPMVILEALANAVPVVSFDSPTGPRNIIQNYENSIIVKLDDTEAFADALVTFADNEMLQKKMSENALATAKKYDIAVVMNLWQSLIFEP